MDSSFSGKDEIWYLRVCHHVPHELYEVTARERQQDAEEGLEYLVHDKF